VKYWRTFAGPDGESHGEDVEADLVIGATLPGSPPWDLSPPQPALQIHFGRAPAGWYWDWHPSPRRQIALTLAGEVDVATSDGTTRRLGPGSVWLHEDTTGKGHNTRVIGPSAWEVVLVVLAEE
jgi:hypothetical protein